MKKLNLFSILTACAMVFSLSFVACGNGETEKSDEEKKDILLDMEDEVMQVHDEVMPLTNELRGAANQLRAYLQERGEEIDDATRDEINDLIERLEEADGNMFDWMGEWTDTDRDNFDFEEAEEYYRDQKEEVDEIAEDMRASLDEAKMYLSNLNQRDEANDQ